MKKAFLVHGVGRYYTTGKKALKNREKYYASDETAEREFGAYKPIEDASPKYVLSLDKADLSRNGIAHMNIIDFLLYKKDLALT